ncbi:hypothetical protein LTR86_005538 [Recurvomyces mirabilis]|nr:hypothetical protein LTR86_005538 [Recurvomyces mirabilis]
MSPTGVTTWKAIALLLAATAISPAIAQQSQGPTVIASADPSATATSPTSTITPASTLNSASGSATTSNDAPLSLWSQAESLLSSYYPSTTLTQVASLTWPSAVVIGSSTYSVPASSISSVAPARTGSSTNANPSQQPSITSDQKLGIGIGVALGAVALILLALVGCCLHRRKKSTGIFFKRRGTPSITDSDIGAWRSPMQRHTSILSTARPNNWAERYDRMPEPPMSSLQPPPMAMHPAYARQYSNYSSSEDNPFFTPEEQSLQHEMAGAAAAKELHAEPAGQRDSYDSIAAAVAPCHSSDSIQPEPGMGNRPPTPFSPMMMMANTRDHGTHPAERSNPFSSPEDDEADDIVSPILPSRSPERRHSPMIHYPSWGEVSEFDFSGEGSRGRSVRGQSSYESSSGDEYRPRRESVLGRYELA